MIFIVPGIEDTPDHRPDLPVLRHPPINALENARVQDEVADRGHMSGEILRSKIRGAVDDRAVGLLK